MRDDVQSVIGAAVEQWSSAWFNRTQLRLLSVKPITAGTRGYGDDGEWRLSGSSTAINCQSRTLARLVEWALGAEMESSRASPTAIDSRLLIAFEQRLIDDLTNRVDKALGLAANAGPPSTVSQDPLNGRGGALFGVGDEISGRLFWLAAPLDPLISACKRLLPARPRRTPVLTSRRVALGPQLVTFEACLGEAELTLDDLQGLAPGDVLVFNKSLADAADIKLPGQTTVVARAKLSQVDGWLALALEPQIR